MKTSKSTDNNLQYADLSNVKENLSLHDMSINEDFKDISDTKSHSSHSKDLEKPIQQIKVEDLNKSVEQVSANLPYFDLTTKETCNYESCNAIIVDTETHPNKTSTLFKNTKSK